MKKKVSNWSKKLNIDRKIAVARLESLGNKIKADLKLVGVPKVSYQIAEFY